MAELGPDQRRQLDALRRAYEQELPGKVTSIARAAAALGGADGEVRLDELYHLVHRLAGSSALWGFGAVSQAAAELEAVVLSAREGQPALLERRSSEVRRLVGDLRRALRAPRRASERPANAHERTR
jgi:HPt (histidine-containing phosphotransfer) domain-containing protein